MSTLDAPTPGQSLTSDKDNPAPWEKAPAYTTNEEAMSYIFTTITEEGRYEEVLDFMRKGIPIETLVKLILGNGFLTGKWTVDLQLLLIEPTAYLLMWLADNVDIEPVLEVDGDEDMYAEEKLLDQASIAMSEMSAKPRPTMVELESQVSPSLLSDMSTFKNKG